MLSRRKWACSDWISKTSSKVDRLLSGDHFCPAFFYRPILSEIFEIKIRQIVKNGYFMVRLTVSVDPPPFTVSFL